MKFLKYPLIVLGILVLVVVIIILAAFFLPPVKPEFVNKNLVFENQLVIPSQLTPHLENGEKVFDLTMQQGVTGFFQGKATKTFGFNGIYLGPTIRVHTGDKVRMNVTNNLDQAATVHWHGMHLPASMDGGPHQVIEPTKTWQPNWTITNEASTLWYHSHIMEKTGEQVYRGLAGLFIIDDKNSDSLALPKNYGVDDIPVVVQDREFDQNGQFVYHHDRTDIFGDIGMLGNKILINGIYAPFVKVPATQIRLRVVNASNARRYNFGFEDNRKFYQITTDGGFLNAPVARTRMILSPGERAEIVVDLANQTKPLILVSDAIYEQVTVFRFMKHLLGVERDENQMFKIIELRPQPTTVQSTPLPKTLNTIQKLDATKVQKTREFVLDRGSQTINGKKMDAKRVDEIVHAGDIEIWKIKNNSGTYHPFHIHAVQFLILDRNGKTPEDYEQGWKDTVLVHNGEDVRVIMRFPEYTDAHLPYMFHCHILEHEDMGMMGQFVVVNNLSDPVGIQSSVINASEEMHMKH